jgi:hypothetical protein
VEGGVLRYRCPISDECARSRDDVAITCRDPQPQQTSALPCDKPPWPVSCRCTAKLSVNLYVVGLVPWQDAPDGGHITGKSGMWAW